MRDRPLPEGRLDARSPRLGPGRGRGGREPAGAAQDPPQEGRFSALRESFGGGPMVYPRPGPRALGTAREAEVGEAFGAAFESRVEARSDARERAGGTPRERALYTGTLLVRAKVGIPRDSSGREFPNELRDWLDRWTHFSDLKSWVPQGACGFNPRPRHQIFSKIASHGDPRPRQFLCANHCANHSARESASDRRSGPGRRRAHWIRRQRRLPRSRQGES
jgi:hypothetical protein